MPSQSVFVSVDLFFFWSARLLCGVNCVSKVTARRPKENPAALLLSSAMPVSSEFLQVFFRKMTKGVCGLVMEGIVELASSSKVTAGSFVLLQATDFCFLMPQKPVFKTCSQLLFVVARHGIGLWHCAASSFSKNDRKM